MANFPAERWDYSRRPTQEIEMSPIVFSTLAARVVSLPSRSWLLWLSVAAIATFGTDTDATGGGILARMSEYVTQLGEAFRDECGS
jgi:hypothetical protein